MFTGLIDSVGRIERVLGRQGNRLLTVRAGFASEVDPGDSIAVNGVCLTVTQVGQSEFVAEAVASTLKTTTLGRLRVGDSVNLERALALGDRLGGHMVQGHVDEVGRVRRIERHAGYRTIAVEVDRRNSGFLVSRGSVAVDGVSLTVACARPGEFSVNIIPHTWDNTALRTLRPGALVNVEYDLLIKAVMQQSVSRKER
ncbi:MAG: riboflavin synthase [candidate division WOR-3 bacterium]